MKRRGFIIGSVMLLLFAIAVHSPADENAGDRLLAEGRWEAALREYLDAHARRPYEPELNLKIARLLVQHNRGDDALLYLGRVLLHNAEHHEAHYLRAQVLQKKQEWDAALTEYIQLLPTEDPVIHLNIGYIYLQQGQLARARAELRETSRLADPGECRARAHWYLFRIDEVTSPATALPHLDEALRLYDGWQNEYQIAVAYYLQHRPASAVELAKRIHSEQDTASSASQLGRAYLQVDRPHDGVALLRRALELEPTRNADRQLLAKTLQTIGLTAAAADEYEYLWNAERDLEHLYAAAAAQTAAGNLAEAVAYWEQIVRVDPAQKHLIAYTKIALEAGELVLARNQVETILAASPEHQEALRLAAMIAVKSGDPASAISYREKLLSRTWQPSVAVDQLQALVKLERFAEAAPLAERLFVAGDIAAGEILAHVKYELGRNYWAEGNVAEAISYLKEARDLKCVEPDLFIFLGDAFIQIGDTAAARREWIKLEKNTTALARLARLAELEGDKIGAAHYLQAYWDAGGNEFSTVASLVEVLAERDEPETAISILQPLASDTELGSWLLLGRMQYQAGNIAAARISLEHAANIQPYRKELMDLMLRIYMDLDETSAAASVISKLLAMFPDEGLAYLCRGRLAYRNKQYTQAAVDFDLAVTRLATPEAYYWRAKNNYARHLLPEAATDLERAWPGVDRGAVALLEGQVALRRHHYYVALNSFAKAAAAGVDVSVLELAAARRGVAGKMIRQGQLPAAELLLAQAEEVHPTPEGNFLQGLIHLKSGDVMTARSRWESGLDFAEPDRRTVIALARMYRVDDPRRALAVLQKLQMLTITDAAVRGRLHYARGQARAAFTDLSKAWEGGIRSTDIALMLAATAGHPTISAGFYHQAIAGAPDSPAVYVQAATFFRNTDQPRTGLELLNRAVSRRAISPDLLIVQAKTLEYLGYDTMALAVWERVPPSFDRRGGGRLALRMARRELERGRLIAGENLIHQAEVLGLEELHTLATRGFLGLWQGELGVAAMTEEEQEADLMTDLCVAVTRLRQADTATAYGLYKRHEAERKKWAPICLHDYARLIASTDPLMAVHCYELALARGEPIEAEEIVAVLDNMTDKQEVTRFYQKLLAQYPSLALTGAAARQALARGEPQRAMRIIGSGLQRHPEAAILYLIAGHVRLATGDLERAEYNYQKALTLEPQSGREAYAGLAGVREAQGQTHEAERFYLTALEHYPEELEIYADLVEFYRRHEAPGPLLHKLREFVQYAPYGPWQEQYNHELWRQSQMNRARGNTTEEERQILELLQDAPGYSLARQRLVEIYFPDDPARARAHLWLGAILDPTDGKYNLLDAEYAMRHDDYERAAWQYARTRQIDRGLIKETVPAELLARYLQGDTTGVETILPLAHNLDDIRVDYVRGIIHAPTDPAAALQYMLEVLRRKRDYRSALLLAGDYARQAGKTAQAVKLLGEYINLNPENIEAKYMYVQALYQQGDQRSALKMIQQLLAIAPETPQYHVTAAEIFVKAGRLADAREHFLTAMRIQPAALPIKGQLGELLVAMADQEGIPNEERIAYLTEALEYTPGNSDAHFRLTRLHRRAGALDQALYHLEQARGKYDATRLIRMQLQLAKDYRALGKLDQARGLFQELMADTLVASEASTLLGVILLEQDEPLAALEAWGGLEQPYLRGFDLDQLRRLAADRVTVLAAVMKDGDSHADGQVDTANVPVLSEETRQALTMAREQLERAVRATPEDDQLRVRLAEICVRLGDQAMARRQFEAALRRRRSAEALAGLANIIAENKEWAEAVILLSEAVRLQPSDFLLRQQYGEVLWRDGQLSRAEQELQLVVDNMPDSYSCYQLGRVFEAQEKPDAALRLWEKSLEYGYPDDFAFRVARGNAYYLTAGYDSAIMALTQAEAEAPGNMWVRLKLGEAWSEKGAIDEALPRFRLAQAAVDADLRQAAREAELRLYAEVGWWDKANAILTASKPATLAPELILTVGKLGIQHQPSRAFALLRDLCRRNTPPSGDMVVAALQAGLEAGQLTSALALAEDFATYAAEIPEYHVALGKLHAAAGQLSAAQLEANAQLGRTHPGPAYILSAEVLQRQGARERSAQAFARAITLRIDHSESFYTYGRLQLDGETPSDEVFDILERAYILKPENNSQTSVIARAALHYGRLDIALRLYRLLASQELAPTLSKEVLNNLSVLFVAGGLYREALSLLDQIPTESEGYHFNRGIVLFHLEDYEAAAQEWQLALRDQPSVELLNNLGTLYLQQGRIEQAMAQFTAGLQRRPNDVLLLMNLGRGYRRAGRLPQAIEILQKAARQDDPAVVAEVRMDLAEALFQAGKYREARIECEEVRSQTENLTLLRRAQRQLEMLDRLIP